LIEERAARETLRKAGEMKDEFLAVVSHELKNPLAVIHMSAQLLTRLPEVGAEPRAARATQAIKSAVTSQTKIINDLLELSRVSAGKVVLARAMVDMPGLIRNIVDAVKSDLGAKGQTLEVDLVEPLGVVADPVRLEQIVWNLLTNAIKFTPARGHIRITLVNDGNMAKLTVADSGIGVEEKFLQGIFEMFRQVDTGPSRKNTGLGIGLALVKQLAELHGGRVEATSEGPNRGTQFHVWLPLGPIAPDTQTQSAARQHGLVGLRILLVDDEAMLLSSFSELLALEGATVVTADSALRAFELAQSAPFDVVVSDIAMPEHDGYWLARQLRATQATSTVPIVAVSGMARETDRVKALEAGFDAHTGKPLDLESLRREIQGAMARRA
jgi:two-component system CheB/CheR fusion protein